MLLFVVVLFLLAVRSLADLNVAYTSYYNDFIEPSYVLGKNWSSTTVVAQQSIVQWADWLAAKGPWCTFHSFSFPSLLKSPLPQIGWKCCSRHDFQVFFCTLQQYSRLSQLGTIVSLTQCPLTRCSHSAHTKLLAKLHWCRQHYATDATTKYFVFHMIASPSHIYRLTSSECSLGNMSILSARWRVQS